MRYHSYQHVERYNREEFESFRYADNIYVFPKLDGTAGVVTAEHQFVYAGSRNRQVSIGDDNQGFAAWVESYDPEAIALRGFCKGHENLHVHGEWLGAKKCLGTIKDYVKTGFWIYDVFNEDTGEYLDFSAYFPMLTLYGVMNVIVPIAVLDNYDEEKFVELATNNHFLLPENKVGEGIVLKSYGWRDKYGKQQFLKLVLDEFKDNKGKGRDKSPKSNNELSVTIINDFVTAADIDKAYNKCKLVCGEAAPLHKVLGMTMNMVFDDFLSEEMTEVVRKYKYPTLNFGELRALVNEKVRAQLIK